MLAGDGNGRRRSALPKERPSGRIIRLLAAFRPSRAGPLPVQTGFPTSLADLVVKNHGRLKKHPSPSSKRGASASPSPSPSPSAPTSPSLSPPAESPPPPTAAVAVSPSDRPRPDLPPAQPPRRGKGGGFGPGLGLGFLAVSGVVSLALLVIWSKVVAAVTVASFSLYLLESVRSSSLPRRRPRPVVTERRLSLDGRGRVSPIREVDAETEPSRPSCSDSDGGSEACILVVEESSGILDESSNLRAKAKANKKSWKKLLASAKKLHRGRSREADSSGSFHSDGDGHGNREDDDMARGSGNAKADSSGSRRGAPSQLGAAAEDAAAREADSSRSSRRSQGVDVDAAHVEIDASVDDLIEEEEQAGIRFPALVLVAIVLVGLVAGKVVALALTVLSSAFLGSVQRSICGCGCGGGGCSQGRRLELSVS